MVICCAVVVAPTKKLEDSKLDQPSDMELTQPVADKNSSVLPNEENTLSDAIKPKHKRRKKKKASSQQ